MRLFNLDLRLISLLCATFEIIVILYHNYILFYMHQKMNVYIL